MKMKLPTSVSGNGYNSHEVSIIAYLSEGSDEESDEIDLPTLDGDFSEYMWMENEEEFDQQVMKQLEEEALMEQCIEAMLEDEHESRLQSQNANQNNQSFRAGWSNMSEHSNNLDIVQSMGSLHVSEEVVVQSTLNPNALEFVPRQKPPTVQAVSVGSKG